jgi:hypothetical protein
VVFEHTMNHQIPAAGSNGARLDRLAGTTTGRFEERHFSPAEIGERWNLSADVIRKLFEKEPGVLVIGEDAPKGKRRYTTLRIPQSVVERVHRRRCNPNRSDSRKGAAKPQMMDSSKGGN